MAILEKEVWVNLKSSVHDHYKNKGYDIDDLKVKDKWGRMRIPKNTLILVKLEDLPCKSGIKVTKICDECGNKIPDQHFRDIIKNRKNGIDRCQRCGSQQQGFTKTKNLKYENSLEYFSLANNKKYLLEEFSENNNLFPNEISKGSCKIYNWICNTCKSEYPMSINNRTNREQNCPFCSGRKVNHTNSLKSLLPDVAKLLKDKSLGNKLTCGSDRKVVFICPSCAHENHKIVNNVVNRGFNCSKCGDGLNYPEKFMMDVLEQLSIEYKHDLSFDWSKGRRYDFYILSLNCIIETHGQQHYKESNRGRSLEEEQENDRLKKEIAIKYGIVNYFEIDCSKSDMEHIKNSLTKNEYLSSLINFNKINWENCHEFALGTLISEVAKLYNEGNNNSSIISDKLNISRSTVIKYLKEASKLNLCAYDPIDAIKENGKNTGGFNKRKIVQLSLNYEFIREWDSAMEAGKKLKEYGIKTENSNISSVCRGVRKSTGGYKWMYKEDYDKSYISNKI